MLFSFQKIQVDKVDVLNSSYPEVLIERFWHCEENLLGASRDLDVGEKKQTPRRLVCVLNQTALRKSPKENKVYFAHFRILPVWEYIG